MNSLHKPKGLYKNYFKRIFDFTLSLAALIVLSPVLLVLTLVGAVAMRGNPFFIQKRPGMIDKKTGQEKIFSLIKFRTMSNAKDKNGNLLPDKNRLTAYGKFLRSTSCDELLELINILKGDMSIVGPRPLLIDYLPYYTREERTRHSVRPGLTGLAQINGRNYLMWNQRLALDVTYAQNVTLANDIKIIFDTVIKVIKRSDVSEARITPLNIERAQKESKLGNEVY